VVVFFIRWLVEGTEVEGMVLLVRPLLSFKRLKCAEDLYLYIFERRGMKRQQTLRRENKINVHVIDFPLACAGQCVCLWMMLLPWTASPCFAAASAFAPACCGLLLIIIYLLIHV